MSTKFSFPKIILVMICCLYIAESENILNIYNAISQNVTSFSPYGGTCANDPSYSCDEKCMKLLEYFKEENQVSTWNYRHPHIARVANRYNVSISVEIGVARCGLSKYLLENVPSIREHHGVDPFIGGYDNNGDFMSNILKQTNQPLLWSQAILKYMFDFACRFRMHLGYSSDVAPKFNGKISLAF